LYCYINLIHIPTFIRSFIHAFVARIPFTDVCIFTLCLISIVPHERVIPNVSDLKVLTNQVVFKWQVPPSIHFTTYLPNVFSNYTLPFVKVYHIRPYPFKGNRQVFPCIFVFTNLKVIDRPLLTYFHAYSLVTISKVISRIYFYAHSSVTTSKVIDMIYFHAYSSVTISKVIGIIYFFCIFVGYYFKGNRLSLSHNFFP